MILRAEKNDLREILELQYAAFLTVSRAMKVEDIPPLHDTLEDLEKSFLEETFLKYIADGKIIGSVRGRLLDDGSCYIGKLIVEPASQKHGIGRKLMREIETYFPDCEKYVLFTAAATPHTSRMYVALGYAEINRRVLDGIEMIFMEKPNR